MHAALDVWQPGDPRSTEVLRDVNLEPGMQNKSAHIEECME